VASRPRESRAFLAWATLATLAVAAVFYGQGRAASGGDWPAPLDDVYIHYDFARSWATGHPFEWIAGQGYSSGETSPAYACVLAAGYAVGFRGAALGVWAACVACASLVFMMRAIRRLVCTGRRDAWVAVLAAPMLLACGTLDFAWWSGMEVALFGAVAAALLVAVDDARSASAIRRAGAEWRAGMLGALLVLVRPEAAVVVAVASVVVARRSGAASAIASCLRVAVPGASATLAIAGLNRLFTGNAASAGALLKLLSSNPFATDEGRAKDYVVNLVTLVRAMAHDLGDGSGRFAYLLPLLACASLLSRRTRALGVLCLGGAIAFALLASWNGAARYQNLRDYMPAVALVLFGAALGLSALAAHRASGIVAGCVMVVAIALGASHVGESARFYARASRNIHDQQVTVGQHLARDAPRDAIVLVGDAGAIPYASCLHAIDALGLGGYGALPFVRAAVHGEAATLELIERLPTGERPTILALYPNWFPGITGRFGHERERVTITDNVICGGVTKGIYDADWSTLGDGGHEGPLDGRFPGVVLDDLDVADVLSEAAHAYALPAPDGGWTLFDVRTLGDGARRFDAGRIVPAGEVESFTLAVGAPASTTILIRTDDVTADAVLEARSADGRPLAIPFVHDDAKTAGAWRLEHARLPKPVAAGTRVSFRVTRGELHDFHAWLVQGNP
jgi:hypothetical protein